MGMRLDHELNSVRGLGSIALKKIPTDEKKKMDKTPHTL